MSRPVRGAWGRCGSWAAKAWLVADQTTPFEPLRKFSGTIKTFAIRFDTMLPNMGQAESRSASLKEKPMSKLRALLVSSLLATALIGGALSTGGPDEAKAPSQTLRDGSQWCC
jgi:hypothetical protein